MKRNTALEIAAAAGGKQSSPEHKRFQTLLGKIEKARARLQTWQEQLPLFAQLHQAQVGPLIKRLWQARRDYAFALEQVLLKQRWSKTDTQTLTRVLCDTAAVVVGTADEEDLEAKALYDRWSDVGYDEADEEELQSMKAMLEGMGGVDLGDEPAESVEELMQRAHAKMAQQHEQHQQHEHQAQRPPPRKNKTAAQKRAEEDERRISQTVREVYRKLAAVLHPDRVAADASADERARSTELMQRANSAYEAGDLLSLLNLQLQIEQVDIAHAAGIAASQIKHFNKVLAEQLRELDDEIDGRQAAFCESYGLLTERRIDPKDLGLLMKDQLQELQGVLARLAMERKLLSGEPANAKRYLKQLRAQQRYDDQMDDFFF